MSGLIEGWRRALSEVSCGRKTQIIIVNVLLDYGGRGFSLNKHWSSKTLDAMSITLALKSSLSFVWIWLNNPTGPGVTICFG